MLGQPMSMLLPQVVGFRLHGALREGATATDLVLTVTELLRSEGRRRPLRRVLRRRPRRAAARRPRHDRQHVAGVRLDLRDLPDRRRDAALPALQRPRPRSRSSWSRRTPASRASGTTRHSEDAVYSDTLELDLGDVEPSLAGPRRPQDRVAAEPARASASTRRSAATSSAAAARAAIAGELTHGDVVIAAITSCTNTSNPSVMIARRAARQGGGRARPRRASRGSRPRSRPGSRVVTEYLDRAGLTEPLEALGFHLVGYGCTTCIGNSGPLPEEVSRAITERDLAVAAVLSGNRNFEGRIQPEVKMNYLASPPLVVAYALAGTMDIDLATDPLGEDRDGAARLPARHLAVEPRDRRRPSSTRCSPTCSAAATPRSSTATSAGTRWPCRAATATTGASRPTSAGRRSSTACRPSPSRRADIAGARVLARARRLGHDRPHLAGRARSSATARPGATCSEHGVEPSEFNSYGARRGNHEVMMRGTFANIRLRNLLGGPGRERLPRGRLHAPPPRRRGAVDLRRGDALRARRACRSSCSAARSTAPAPRATGPRRARACSACGR